MEFLDKDSFLLGEPIETDIGLIRFLTVSEYLKTSSDLLALNLNILHLYHRYRKMLDDTDKEVFSALEELKSESLFNFINENKDFKESYLRVFSMVLDMNDKGDVMNSLERIFEDEALFMGTRQLIMEMQLQSETPVSDNLEIQEYYETRAEMKRKEAGDQSFSDIISSVVAGTSNSFKDVRDMTIIQLYSIYYRIGAFKNFDVLTLFASVGNKDKIEPWDKHIDLFSKAELGIDYSEFNRQYGGLFD